MFTILSFQKNTRRLENLQKLLIPRAKDLIKTFGGTFCLYTIVERFQKSCSEFRLISPIIKEDRIRVGSL